MKNNYRINFAANTLIMSKSFEEAAHNPYSNEYKILQRIRSDFPGLVIKRKTRRSPKRARPNKNLTYDNMIKYMSVYENAAELLSEFNTVRAQSLQATCPYNYVLSWFNERFPQHREPAAAPDGKPKMVSISDAKSASYPDAVGA